MLQTYEKVGSFPCKKTHFYQSFFSGVKKNMQQDLLLQSWAIHELKASFNKKAPENSKAFKAVRTGLEPATFRVTGGHSNQLNYQTIKIRLQR